MALALSDADACQRRIGQQIEDRFQHGIETIGVDEKAVAAVFHDVVDARQVSDDDRASREDVLHDRARQAFSFRRQDTDIRPGHPSLDVGSEAEQGDTVLESECADPIRDRVAFVPFTQDRQRRRGLRLDDSREDVKELGDSFSRLQRRDHDEQLEL